MESSLFRKLYQRLKSDSSCRPKRRQTARLSVEPLEDRFVLSTFWVADAEVVEGNAGATTAAVVVSLSAPAQKTVSVNFTTTDGTANAGSDYDAANGKLVFAPGETNKTILIPVRSDRLGELDESFFVTLSGARGANAKISDGQGLVTIADDEPRIWISDWEYFEGDSGTSYFTIPVFLSVPNDEWDESRAYDMAVSVSFAWQDGAAVAGVDFLPTTGTLSFAPGETTKTIELAIYGDRLVEGHESFFVNLSGAQNALIVPDQGKVTILDNEPEISIYDAYYTGESTFTFTVGISPLYDDPVTVNFATADGTAIAGADYVATSGTLTFAPGERFKTITVEVLNPTETPGKYFYVQLSGASANARIWDEWAFGYFEPWLPGGYPIGDY
jgi:hypothetical protein